MSSKYRTDFKELNYTIDMRDLSLDYLYDQDMKFFRIILEIFLSFAVPSRLIGI